MRIVRRILINAVIAMAMNFTAVCIAGWYFHASVHIHFMATILRCLFLPVCLFNVFLLAATGGLLAVREERLIRQRRKERLKQLICHKDLPDCASDYIERIVKKMRYRFKVRHDVAQELADHFIDALSDCENQAEKREIAQALVEQFGDAQLVAVLARRAKKRCRPIWLKAMIHSLQAIGVIIILLCLYTVWFVAGKPTVSTDYLAVINEKQKNLKAAISDENNAWPNYKKAAELFVKPDKETREVIYKRDFLKRLFIKRQNLTNEQNAVMAEWIKKNEQAWQQFLAGSKKKYCYIEMEYESFNTTKLLNACSYPELSFDTFARNFGALAKCRVWMETEPSQLQKALQDCFVMLNVARQLREKSYWLTEHMVGVLISREALEGLLYIVRTNELSAGGLKKLQQQLEQMYAQGYPQLDLCLEMTRMNFLDLVQHTFTDGGPGGGHMTPLKSGFNPFYFHDLTEEHLPYLKRVKPITPYVLSVLHARRDETIAKANEIFDKIKENIIKKSPYERYILNIKSEDFISDLPKHRYFLIHEMIGGNYIDGRSDAVYRINSGHEAVVAILVLKRWRLEKGRYPQKLDELLKGGYLKKLPDDPYSDGPLVYKRVNGDFTLYSLGADFDDDGGLQTPKDRWGQKEHGGDRVFWPVAKPK